MSLSWYVHRLRSMDAREIVHRVRERARRWHSRGRHEGWRRYADEGALRPIAWLREALQGAGAGERERIAAAARHLLEGRFEALGQVWPRRAPDALFPDALWRLDPVSGDTWPGSDTYCHAIEYRRVDRLGDIKYVWEINRLQLLQPLAAQALLGEDADALAAVEAAVASWHAANPPFRGVGWASGIEVALRTISIGFAVSVLSDRLAPATLSRARAILAASRFWLARFPSRYSSANNHLIAELAGEYIASVMLGAGPAATERLRAALAAEALRQILPDGVGAEQSPSYAAFTVEVLLLCMRTAEAAGTPFPSAVAERLGRFAEFAGWIGRPDGSTLPLGDDDEGRAITLCTAEPGYVTSVAAAAAAVAGTSEPGVTAAPQLRNLLFGQAGGPQPEGLRTFPEGGYSVWRGCIGERRLLLGFDHGPLGYLAIAAHGHADALSVVLDIDGEPVLVDPGTYLYQSGGEWRRWFRGTRAHNSLSLAGSDQSIIAGPFNWSHKARARLDAAEGGDAWRLEASHDGYRHRFRAVHRRSIARAGDIIRICDSIEGSPGGCEAEVSFQLAPGLDAAAEAGAVRVSRAGRALLELRFASAEVTIAAGGPPGSGGGWIAPAFGCKLPAPRISWRGRIGAEPVAVELVV